MDGIDGLSSVGGTSDGNGDGGSQPVAPTPEPVTTDPSQAVPQTTPGDAEPQPAPDQPDTAPDAEPQPAEEAAPAPSQQQSDQQPNLTQYR